MQKIIINIHSLIDFISNSSSELFICSINKTLETIKDILTDLAKKRDIPHDVLFGTMIKEPSICQYDFDLDLYPNRAEYRQFTSFNWDNKSQLEQETGEKWQEWEANNKIDYPKSPYKYGTDDYKKYQDEWYKTVYLKFLNSKKYKTYQEKKNKAYREIHADLDKKRNEIQEEMLKWFFELNKIPYTPITCPENLYSLKDPVWEKWQEEDNNNIQFNNARNEFEQAASYDYKLKKGNILIESQGDNTIPWKLMDDINAVLGGQRIHIG